MRWRRPISPPPIPGCCARRWTATGENLIRGFENLLRDLEAGEGQLRIAQTDMSAFEVGRNVAVTPGKVVLRNDLMELIQYAPATETVHEVPLLIVPPWINKYYILDLTPENSFVRWAVEQGHTVFVISWVNPDSRLSDKAFEDYMAEGPLAALDAIERITGARRANAIGYCLGGTLLAVALAWLAARGETPIESATYFASLVDFSEVGELGVFIDEEQVAALEARMDQAGGVLEGADMATTFNMLRANDLIWSFVVNNYLLGRDPVPFDLLFWNADSTRMPKRMHSFYLRRMYMDNALADPGALEVASERLDLTAVKTRTYVVGTREDHIAPWPGVYRGRAALRRAGAFRARGVRAHRRHRQSAGGGQIQPLDPSADAEGQRVLAGAGGGKAGFMVARLVRLGRAFLGRPSARAHPRRRWAARALRRPRHLCRRARLSSRTPASLRGDAGPPLDGWHDIGIGAGKFFLLFKACCAPVVRVGAL